MTDDDELLFAEESESGGAEQEQEARWRILIVDDEPAIHNVTKLALDEFSFMGRDIEYLHAYSGAEAREVLADNDDIAMTLLDVVMETDHEGLDVVRYIRETLDNSLIRIILRTGQPGQAPALKVITEYDINDYKEKSELTAEKLIASVYTGLSAYRDLRAIDANRMGLEKVVEATAEIFEQRTLSRFAQGVLHQLQALLYLDNDALMVRTSGIAAHKQNSEYEIIAGAGRYANYINLQLDKADLNETIVARIREGIAKKGPIYGDDYFVAYFSTSLGSEEVLYVSGSAPLSVPDRRLIELLCRNISIAYENLELHKEVEDSQREVVFVLSEAIEQRSKETGNHVRRVGEFSRLLGQLYGLDDKDIDILTMASPLHDAGKIGIPDAILNKPGKHDDDERRIMKQHATMGKDLLAGYKRPLLKAASIIAGEHHEKWDGSGYPEGKHGEDIHIFGRITALADIFDALASDRCYKKAWPIEEVLDYVKQESGKTFDPKLVSLLLDNLDDFLAIRERYADVYAEAG